MTVPRIVILLYLCLCFTPLQDMCSNWRVFRI
jgi:hypothetical protein